MADGARRILRDGMTDRRVVAELVAGGWEFFSALLFISAVYPAAAGAIWPVAIFLASIALSAAIGRSLMARGEQGYDLAAGLRAASWLVAVAPVLRSSG